MAGRKRDERIALIDEKIEKKHQEILELEAKKQKLLHPITVRSIIERAKEAGLSPEEIAEKLGINV